MKDTIYSLNRADQDGIASCNFYNVGKIQVSDNVHGESIYEAANEAIKQNDISDGEVFIITWKGTSAGARIFEANVPEVTPTAVDYKF